MHSVGWHFCVRAAQVAEMCVPCLTVLAHCGGLQQQKCLLAAAGFQNLATEELCARWIAVGAWQPFARVHHAQSFQELYR